MIHRERIEDILDKYRDAVVKRVRREIDASACSTRHDFEAFHVAEDSEEAERTAAIANLLRLVREVSPL